MRFWKRKRGVPMGHDWKHGIDPGPACPCEGCKNRTAFLAGPTPPGWQRTPDGGLRWGTGIYRTGAEEL
jgi:hypothetical protein